MTDWHLVQFILARRRCPQSGSDQQLSRRGLGEHGVGLPNLADKLTSVVLSVNEDQGELGGEDEPKANSEATN